ncbi:MAG: hypothetical protein ABII18_08395 [bacterium]|nr:hypothetical protein [bacterium]MBU1916490.1 hypothetical protein [bacterium]
MLSIFATANMTPFAYTGSQITPHLLPTVMSKATLRGSKKTLEQNSQAERLLSQEFDALVMATRNIATFPWQDFPGNLSQQSPVPKMNAKLTMAIVKGRDLQPDCFLQARHSGINSSGIVLETKFQKRNRFLLFMQGLQVYWQSNLAYAETDLTALDEATFSLKRILAFDATDPKNKKLGERLIIEGALSGFPEALYSGRALIEIERPMKSPEDGTTGLSLVSARVFDGDELDMIEEEQAGLIVQAAINTLIKETRSTLIIDE